MANINLRLEKNLTNILFRSRLRGFLSKNTSVKAFACTLRASDAYEDDDDPDILWFFEELTDNEREEMSEYQDSFFVSGAEIITRLRYRLGDEAYPWPTQFSVSLPDFKPIRLPSYDVTREYCDMIEKVKNFTGGNLFFGDADPEVLNDDYFSREGYRLFPLTERLSDRLKEMNMELPEVIGCTFVYTSIAPYIVPYDKEWAIRLTIEVFHEDHIFITKVEVVALHWRTNCQRLAIEEHKKLFRRASLSITVTERSYRMAKERIFKKMNVMKLEGITSSLEKHRRDIRDLSKALIEEREKEIGRLPYYPF